MKFVTVPLRHYLAVNKTINPSREVIIHPCRDWSITLTNCVICDYSFEFNEEIHVIPNGGVKGVNYRGTEYTCSMSEAEIRIPVEMLIDENN